MLRIFLRVRCIVFFGGLFFLRFRILFCVELYMERLDGTCVYGIWIDIGLGDDDGIHWVLCALNSDINNIYSFCVLCNLLNLWGFYFIFIIGILQSTKIDEVWSKKKNILIYYTSLTFLYISWFILCWIHNTTNIICCARLTIQTSSFLEIKILNECKNK